jgi:hypothetical protein
MHWHFNEVYGRVPAPGDGEWRFCDVPIDQSLLLQLEAQSLIVKCGRDRQGVVWSTTVAYGDLAHTLAERREGCNVDECFFRVEESIEEPVRAVSG